MVLRKDWQHCNMERHLCAEKIGKFLATKPSPLDEFAPVPTAKAKRVVHFSSRGLSVPAINVVKDVTEAFTSGGKFVLRISDRERIEHGNL